MIGRTVKIIFGVYEGLYGAVESETGDTLNIRLSYMCYANTGMSYVYVGKNEVKFIN